MPWAVTDRCCVTLREGDGRPLRQPAYCCGPLRDPQAVGGKCSGAREHGERADDPELHRRAGVPPPALGAPRARARDGLGAIEELRQRPRHAGDQRQAEHDEQEPWSGHEQEHDTARDDEDTERDGGNQQTASFFAHPLALVLEAIARTVALERLPLMRELGEGCHDRTVTTSPGRATVREEDRFRGRVYGRGVSWRRRSERGERAQPAELTVDLGGLKGPSESVHAYRSSLALPTARSADAAWRDGFSCQIDEAPTAAAGIGDGTCVATMPGFVHTSLVAIPYTDTISRPANARDMAVVGVDGETQPDATAFDRCDVVDRASRGPEQEKQT
jgi:hypothetical protein